MMRLHALLPEFSATAVPYLHKNGGHTSAIMQDGIADLLAKAHARGHAEATETCRGEAELQHQAQEAHHQHTLESARKIWVDVESRDLSKMITAKLADIEARLSNSLHDVLLPFVEKLIPQTAMDDFQKILQSAMPEDFKGPLHLSGPADLVAKVKGSLAASGIEVCDEVGAHSEVRGRSATFNVTTRIKSWTDVILGTEP